MKEKLLYTFQYRTLPAILGGTIGIGFTYLTLGAVFPMQFVIVGFLVGVTMLTVFV